MKLWLEEDGTVTLKIEVHQFTLTEEQVRRLRAEANRILQRFAEARK